MKEISLKDAHWYILALLVLLAVHFVFYWGGLGNYFFSDDFHWLGRGVLMQDSLQELVSIEGRDFNPVFLALLWLLIKLFGLTPLAFRITAILTFSLAAWVMLHLLVQKFNVGRSTAFIAVLLLGFNVFVSEVVLNLAALVYSLSLLLFLVSLKFYWDKKRLWFIVFLAAAVLTKETVLLAVLPLMVYEKEKEQRLFLAASAGGLIVLRGLLQLLLAGSTGSYTGFLSFGNFFYKLYFTLLRTMNLSPYAVHMVVGIMAILIFTGVSIYYIGKQRGFWFFFSLWIGFSLFFSFLPKLTSRYFFYPATGFWGMAALLAAHLITKNKKLRYALIPLLLLSILLNYPMVQKEIDDYRILGDFSEGFIRQHGPFIKNQPGDSVTIPVGDVRPLADIYRYITGRGNLPKLLPFRQNSISGVIEPRHLIPIIFYPETIARWQPIEKTGYYFKGKIDPSK